MSAARSLTKLVIFDCDGVLVDTENLANRRLAEWLCEAGFATTFEHCRKHFSGRSMASVQKQIEEETDARLGADFVDRWNAGLPDLFAHGVEAIPYVREFVDKVRAAGIAYCVASSARVSKMHITLGQTGLLPLFEHAMFSSTMVGRGKPFPDLFLHAASTMGFAPADCIVIEDSVAGTQAGIAAGMRVFSYHADPLSDRDGLAEAGGILFDDMRELAGLVPIH
ncbi:MULTISPECIES: HAD family phosphatase [unclassified Mesorhizobium]|uniref:HAD family hydrolase n=1 Tax=unclassified Mesorhizobium TaxID=325217 RepID=UPI000BB09FA0|nr:MULTISPECIES: HAD family phosphatase [unclassified Mesorhizobium]TGT54291.1 HAD family phosphatase [Mesorhizobium sp. M00.F.Ca.ET.170.01.1.1]AZO10000.1 HAD family phosphatase [Mesorhizobium sp. M3A.F.Ca.ET.080.04.2.1]PBB86467.1 HAD family hydrolase [Mesorhizobium sp. WSM3876]RWB75685.1 MAG: HAD family phosphatase [Mesorhizobium sp.]RWB86536.1 MAG: HAD family phosphatase [Mesorhizobium sp.]